MDAQKMQKDPKRSHSKMLFLDGSNDSSTPALRLQTDLWDAVPVERPLATQ